MSKVPVRAAETAVGAVVLAAAAAFLWIGLSRAGASGGGGGYEVEALFTDASGLERGTEVRLSGVRVGEVVGRTLDPESYSARVRLRIADEVALPSDTSARVLPEGLLGGSYLSLTPGGAFDMIPPGGRIEYTQDALNLVDLLGRFIFSGGGGGDKDE